MDEACSKKVGQFPGLSKVNEVNFWGPMSHKRKNEPNLRRPGVPYTTSPVAPARDGFVFGLYAAQAGCLISSGDGGGGGTTPVAQYPLRQNGSRKPR